MLGPGPNRRRWGAWRGVYDCGIKFSLTAGSMQRSPSFARMHKAEPYATWSYDKSVSVEDISRRALLASGALLLSRPAKARAKLKVSVFSKHLQFVQGEELAAAAAGLGFDGVDITLRKGGHVDPGSVAKDLPPLVATLRKHGLEVSMVSTDIADAD